MTFAIAVLVSLVTSVSAYCVEIHLVPGETYTIQAVDAGKALTCKAGNQAVKTITHVYCECTKTSEEHAYLDRVVLFSDGTRERNMIKTYDYWQTDCRGQAATLRTCRL
jgi:hypothetical protein